MMLDREMAVTYARLSACAARNGLFAQKAKKEGNARLARLLAAMAAADDIQARRALMYLRGKIEETGAYLTALTEEKERDAAIVFPALQAQAAEPNVADTYGRFGSVAANHHEALREALEEGPADYFVCQVCGYIAAGEAPERCSVCSAPRKKFKEASL